MTSHVYDYHLSLPSAILSSDYNTIPLQPIQKLTGTGLTRDSEYIHIS